VPSPAVPVFLLHSHPRACFLTLTIASPTFTPQTKRTLSKSNGGKDGPRGSPTYHPGVRLFYPADLREKGVCGSRSLFFSRSELSIVPLSAAARRPNGQLKSEMRAWVYFNNDNDNNDNDRLLLPRNARTMRPCSPYGEQHRS
jgi:hypothetical protein